MKRIANPIETTELCTYGCGNVAHFINGSGKFMCCKSSNSCPENRKKNSKGLKNCGRDYSQTYKNIPEESKKRMNWSKGLTKETNKSLLAASLKMKGKPGTFTGRKHTKEAKEKLSKFRSEYLKKTENRKNLGRHKKSWLEVTFETYLIENNITGWETEVHFWCEEFRKNYYPDFVFENKKLIIELDGTQHRKTANQDSIRDDWFKKVGYKVIRITIEEFKKRYFSGEGFLDLLGR